MRDFDEWFGRNHCPHDLCYGDCRETTCIKHRMIKAGWIIDESCKYGILASMPNTQAKDSATLTAEYLAKARKNDRCLHGRTQELSTLGFAARAFKKIQECWRYLCHR